jgi:hypothetical protein
VTCRWLGGDVDDDSDAVGVAVWDGESSGEGTIVLQFDASDDQEYDAEVSNSSLGGGSPNVDGDADV